MKLVDQKLVDQSVGRVEEVLNSVDRSLNERIVHAGSKRHYASQVRESLVLFRP